MARGPSRTAQGVALLRAAHQILDQPPRILDDPAIVRFFGPLAMQGVRDVAEQYQLEPSRALRAHVLLRSRFAEDRLAEAVQRGATQYVVLGAGFDTFAYRQPAWASGIRVIEVDEPATQAIKRSQLASVGMEAPPNVLFADVDFERESLEDGLARHGVSFDRPTFFSWLGVTMYLTREAIDAVLRTILGFPSPSEVVFTFAQPRPRDEGAGPTLADRAAAVGEPWISYFTPAELHALLRAAGFDTVEFLTPAEAEQRYLRGRTDALHPPRRTSIVSARRT